AGEQPTRRAPAKPKRKVQLSRYEQLDAFRLIVIAVVTFHTFQHSSGKAGTVLPIGSLADSIVSNLDFLLSFYFMMAGFGLAVQLFRPVLAGKPLPERGAFISKRFARLLPVYFVVFLVVWEARYAGTHRQWMDLLWGITLMQSWSTEHIFATIDPAWYLSVEFAFVWIAAFALMPILRRITRIEDEERRWLALAGVGVGCIVVGLAWKFGLSLRHTDYTHWGSWFAPPSWLDLWGIGMLFALGVMRWDRPDRSAPLGVPLLLVVASCAWLWYLGVLSIHGELPRTVRFNASGLGVLGLMIAAVMASPKRITRRIMASKPVQALGACSFGIYLVHAPILRYFSSQGILPLDTPLHWAVSTAALFAMATILGQLTLRYIEIPGQGLVRLHMPERQRKWDEARPVRATLKIGDRAPDAILDRFDDLARPMIVLVGPHASLRPPSQGDPTFVTAQALDDERFVVATFGGSLAGIIAAPDARRAGAGQAQRVGWPVRGMPGRDVVEQVGVGGLKMRSGAVVPHRVAIVIDRDDTVVAMLSDTNGEHLGRDAIAVAAHTAAGGKTIAATSAA
ncbi:MAG: acyltransferase, partial [Patulibacter sp.]|nr:acyltransferase [Patulibacter sp.]